MTEPTMAMGLSLEEIDALLDLIATKNTPVLRLLQHRLWRLRSSLIMKIVQTGNLDAKFAAIRAMNRVEPDEFESKLHLVTD